MRAHETPAQQAGDRSKPRRAGTAGTPAGRVLALQRLAGNAAVSRAVEEERHDHGPGCGHGEAEAGEQPAVQRRVSVQEAIDSPGSRPDPHILSKAQQAYGMSFDHVRLHTGPVAQRSAMEFNAVAYTTGSDIVSQKPRLDDETIYHELDHVRQQAMGPVAGTDNGAGARVSHQDDPFERQSAANGRRLSQGAAPDLSLPGSSAPVQRSTEGMAAHDGPHVQRVTPAAEADTGATYQQTKPTADGDRDVTLRALDRMSRVALKTIIGTNADFKNKSGNPERGKKKITPHLAVSLLPDGALAIAGNTGDKQVTERDKDVVGKELQKYVDSSPELQHAKQKDRTKLKALMTGDYAKQHGENSGLTALAAALRRPIRWYAVGGTESVKSSQHGEMTVLGEHVAHWVANPKDSGPPEKVMMGGVKKACRSCQWAFDAVNEHIGRPRGYEVEASGTHNQFFPGWRMPEWMKGYPEVVAAVQARATAAGVKLENGVLDGPMSKGTVDVGHDPDSSASEWEDG